MMGTQATGSTPYDLWKQQMMQQGSGPAGDTPSAPMSEEEFQGQRAQMLRNQKMDPNTTEDQLRQSGWAPTPTRDTGGGFFGEFGPIIAIAAAFAGSAVGIPPFLTNLVMTTLSGGDPLQSLLSPQGLMSAVNMGMGGGGFGSTPGADVAGSEFGATPDAGGLMDSGAQQPMLLADSGTTQTDVSQGFGDAAPLPDAGNASAGTSTPPGGLFSSNAPGVGDAGAFDQFGARSSSAPDSSVIGNGPATSGPAGTGLLDSTVDWAKKNPQLAGPIAASGITMAGSMLKSVGDRSAAKEIAERKIAGEKELADKKLQNTMELSEWQRRFGQAGAYGGPVGVSAPSGTQALTRPGGQPVYGPNGLLFSA